MKQSQLVRIASSIGVNFNELTQEQKSRLNECVKATLRIESKPTEADLLSEAIGVSNGRYDELISVVQETAKALGKDTPKINISEIVAIASNHVESANELLMIGFFVGKRDAQGEMMQQLTKLKMLITLLGGKI